MTMHYFALVSENRNRVVKRLRVNQSLQNTLASLFEEQAADFLDDGLERVEFDGNYSVDESELFVIPDYEMTDEITEAIKHPTQPAQLTLGTAPLRIKSVFAGEYDSSPDQTTIYFQSFNKVRLLVGGFTILHQQNTFKRLQDPGLTLDTKLIGAYVDGTLHFRSYRTVNGIVDVTEYFREATNEEIHKFLEHKRLAVGDEDKVLKVADSWMRKRFSAVLGSGILDEDGPRKISNRAKRFGITLETRRVNNKDVLVFPDVKADMKKLLTFLNEGVFEGELTGQLYQTNSQRVVPPPTSEET